MQPARESACEHPRQDFGGRVRRSLLSSFLPWRESSVDGRAWFLAEILVVLAVVLATGIAGYQALASHETIVGCFTNEPEYYGTSIMLLAGRGLVTPDLSASPELADFLSLKTDHFDLASLPPDIPVRKPHVFTLIRGYLLVLTAGVWWVFGISWEGLKIVALLFYAGTAVAVYLLFRLSMGRLLGALLTFLAMTTPEMLHHLPNLRDASKGPFLLLVLALLGAMIRRPARPTVYLIYAVLAGLLTGMGLGFRQDLVVCVPACLVVIVLFARGTPKLNTRHRLAAAVLFLSACWLSSLPVPWRGQEGGSEYAHNIVMGMAACNDENMDVGGASYERILSEDDLYVYAVPRQYCVSASTRAPNAVVSGYLAERDYVAASARTFPADALVRGLAAVRDIVQGDELQIRGERLLQAMGMICATATLLLAAGQNLRLGWGLLFLLFYFAGYPSLQFGTRHFAHLVFVPYWFVGTAVVCAIRTVWEFRGTPGRPPVAKFLRSPGLWRGRRLHHATVFLISTVVPGAAILAGATVYQQHTLDGVLDALAQAEIEPLTIAQREVGSVQAVDITPPLQARPGHPQAFWWRSDYLMAEFEAVEESFGLWLRYAAPQPRMQDHSAGVTVEVRPAPGHTVDVKYYFPVHGWFKEGNTEWNAFLGIAMGKEVAKHFRGLYRVASGEAAPLWLHMAVPSDRSATVLRQRIGASTHHSRVIAPLERETNPFYVKRHIHAYWASRPPEETEMRYRKALEKWPDLASLWLEFGLFLEREGRQEEAYAVYVRAIEEAPNLETAYARLSACVSGKDRAEAVVRAIQHLRERFPDAYAPHFFTGQALAACGRGDEAVAAYCETLKRCPNHLESRRAIDQLTRIPCPERTPEKYTEAQALTDSGNKDAAIRLLREVIAEDPGFVSTYAALGKLYENEPAIQRVAAWREILDANGDRMWPYLYLAGALSAAGELDEAKALCRRSMALWPSAYEPCEKLSKLYMERDDVDGLLQEWQGAVRAHPDLALAHYALGMGYERKGKPDEAIAAYTAAYDLDPLTLGPKTKLARALTNQARAIAAKGELEEALGLQQQAIVLDPSDPGARLYEAELLARSGDRLAAMATYRQVIELQPGNYEPYAALSALYLAANDLDGLLRECREAVRQHPDQAAAQLSLASACEKSGDSGGALAAYRKAIELQPWAYDAYEGLSDLYVKRGDLDGLLQEWQKAAHKNADRTLAHFSLGIAHERRGELERAEAAYADAYVLDPGNQGTKTRFAHVLTERARAAAAHGNLDGALELQQKALAVDPGNGATQALGAELRTLSTGTQEGPASTKDRTKRPSIP